jgi:hypothetical protein
VKRPWIATQLYIGKAEQHAFTVEEMKNAIRAAREIAGIDALMIMPATDFALTQDLVGTSRECGIQAYLWFPVLADVPGLTADRSGLVQPYNEDRSGRKSGAWERLESSKDEFQFICPNHGHSLDSVFGIYASLLDRLPVDGVMLDRIRFPSPANGFESLLSCFCSSCKAAFEQGDGLPFETLRERARSFILRIKDLTPFAFAAEWGETDSLWTVAGLERLAAFRRRSVVKAVQRFSIHARSKGLKVGLDLFSYSLSHLVGQDYAALSETCDWVKPMIYCHAVGPAGLPLEIACMSRALRELSPRLGAGGANELLRKLFRWDIPETEERLLTDGLPEKILSSELTLIKGAGLASGVEVYAGIEAVRNPQFGIDITAETLNRYFSHLVEPARGIVASWNLLDIPHENLERIGRLRD